jgi:uncharacterized protein
MRDNDDLFHTDSLAGVIEGFYLETRDDLFFAVKGMEHPPDRIISVLRYARSHAGADRVKGGVRYRRFYHFPEQEQLLRVSYPQYLAYDPAFAASLQSVPRSRIRRVYDPCLRLGQLLNNKHKNGIEEDILAFVNRLQQASGIDFSCIGVTGSLLIGLQNEHSDLDVAVYGTQQCRSCYSALLKILEDTAEGELCRLDSSGFDELYAQRVIDTQMPWEAFVQLEGRKVNQGRFRKRPYFVRFVKNACEVPYNYGQLQYVPVGRSTISASIADDSESIFTPCRYLLENVVCHGGSQIRDLKEVVSFRGRFCEQARNGESVIATGTIELVRAAQQISWHRLLLGNSPDDTMVVMRD